MKKLLIIGMVLTLMVGLIGCIEDNEMNVVTDSEQSGGDINANQNADTQATVDSTEDNTENNTADSTTDSTADTETADSESKSAENPGFYLDLMLEDGEGNPIDLSAYKGKFVFLNFFTTWCGYCMQEMPDFQKYYTENSDNVEIIIVNVQTDPGEKSVDEVVAWYEDAGYTFPMVFDIDASETEIYYSYMTGYPTTFVFNEDGDFVGIVPGKMEYDYLGRIYNSYSAGE